MRKLAIFLLAVFFGAASVSESISARQERHRSTTISIDDEKELTDCSQIKLRFGEAETLRSVLSEALPRAGASTLRVEPPRNGGVHVQGWNGADYSISACVAAAGETAAEAKAVLDQLKLSVVDARVTVEGPTEDWVAYLLIRAPSGVTLDLSGKNGPIGVSDFSGTVHARNQNGPVTFKNVTGQVQATVQNGPIDVTGSSGDFRLNAHNGPLTIALDGSSWSGGEIEGHTQNGPLTVKLPEGYQSPIRIDASKHSPVECRAVQCQQVARTWDRPNVIEFGGGSPVIRLSTVNGPVTVTSRDARK